MPPPKYHQVGPTTMGSSQEQRRAHVYLPRMENQVYRKVDLGFQSGSTCTNGSKAQPGAHILGRGDSRGQLDLGAQGDQGSKGRFYWPRKPSDRGQFNLAPRSTHLKGAPLRMEGQAYLPGRSVSRGESQDGAQRTVSGAQACLARTSGLQVSEGAQDSLLWGGDSRRHSEGEA